MSNDSEVEAAEDEHESEAEAGNADEVPEDGLQPGDFVEIDYTARTVEDGELVDTTDPDIAEEEGVAEGQEFAPRTIVLGEDHIFEPVEEDVYGKEAGDSGTVTLAAADAFGEYDESAVRTISKDKIPEDDRYPGANVQVEGQQGFVETIIGGRARVDFNHPLAGDDIEYEYEILREVEDREERAQGIISMLLDMELDVWFQTDTVEEERLVEPDEDDDGEAEAESEEAEAESEEDDVESEGDEAEADDAAGEDDDEDDDEPPEPETEVVEVEKETLYIEATPGLTMNQQWMMGKQQIAQQLTQLLDVDRIIVQEELGGGPGMMGGMGGMMGGGPGGAPGGADLEAALEEADVDAEEIAEEVETDEG